MAEHRESLSGRVGTETEREDVSERNDAEWESNIDPLRRGIFLVEDVEQDDCGCNRDVEFERIENEVGNPI